MIIPRPHWLWVLVVGVLAMDAPPVACADPAAESPWPAAVPNFIAPTPGEHPRLFFRKADLPQIKARAATPEGKAIVARLRFLLDGKNGDTFPTIFNTNPPVNGGAKGAGTLPIGAFTIGHGPGYAMLYQLTGEQKYADLAKLSLEKMFSGTPDRDERYTWTSPGAGLRTGMLMTCVAMTYDLAYDGWDDGFRRKVVDEIQDYKHVCVNAGGWEGGKDGLTFEKLVNPYYPPGSNHYGSLIGGAATAILAIKGDPGAGDKRLEKLQADVEKNIITVLTKGFGDHGFFAEGPGPSHMAANPALVPALQAMKIAGGKDFISPRPNGQWLSLRWAFEIIPDKEGHPFYPCRNPSSYGTERVKRDGTSDGGEFCQGFGAVPADALPALAWTYDKFVAAAEKSEYPDRFPEGVGDGKSYDALTYPHRAVFSLINFPIGVIPKNPGDILGRSYRDEIHGYLAFRNRWQDADDCLVTAYLKTGPSGFIRNNDVGIRIWGLGMRTRFPVPVTGRTSVYETHADGSGVFSIETAAGVCSVYVDLSNASGAPCLVAMTAPNLKPIQKTEKSGNASAKTTTITAGGRTWIVMTLQKGEEPAANAAGDAITVGGQTLSFDGKRLTAAK